MPKSKLIKQQEASKRQEIRNKRSVSDQLNVLDNKFGKGLGATKERNKLNNIVNKKVEVVDEDNKPKKKKTRSKKSKD